MIIKQSRRNRLERLEQQTGVPDDEVKHFRVRFVGCSESDDAYDPPPFYPPVEDQLEQQRAEGKRVFVTFEWGGIMAPA